MRANTLLAIGLASAACGPADDSESTQHSELVGGNADPSPSISFTQVGKTVGIDRSREPPSAGTFGGGYARVWWVAR